MRPKLVVGIAISLGLMLIAMSALPPEARSQPSADRTTLVNVLVEERGDLARLILALRGNLRGYDLVAGSGSLSIHLNDVAPELEHSSHIVSNPLVRRWVRRWQVEPINGSTSGANIRFQLSRPVTFNARRIPQGLEITLAAAEPARKIARQQPPPPSAPEADVEAPESKPAAAVSPAPATPQSEPVAAAAPAPIAARAPQPSPQASPSKAPGKMKERASKQRVASAASQEAPTSGTALTRVASASQAPESDSPILKGSSAAELGFRGEKISLDFHNAELTNILRAIAEVSGLNIIAGDDVKGAITIRMDDVPWDQALDVVLKVKALVKQREGNIVRILTIDSLKAEEEARRAEIEANAKARLASARAKKAEQEVEVQELSPLTERLIPILYADAKQMKKNLEPFLSKDREGKARGFINVNDHTSTLIVRDTESNIVEIQKIIASLDRPTPQVIIEARIVEATLDFARDLGVQWGFGVLDDVLRLRGGLNPSTGSAVSLPAVGASSALDIAIGNVANTRILDLRLSAFESEGKARIITTPRIATLDNKEAVIQRGDRIPIRVLNQQGVTSTQFIDANLTLTVTPHITLDDFVGMKIEVNLDEPDFSRTSVDGIPTIVTRNARTEVLVKNGSTTVIGGLLQRTMSDNDNQVPGISKIPFFGRLFRRNSKSEQSRELLIFITPTIVRREAKNGE